MQLRDSLYRAFAAFIPPDYCDAAAIVARYAWFTEEMPDRIKARLSRGFGIDKARWERLSGATPDLPTPLRERFRVFLIVAGVSPKLASEMTS